MGRKSTLTASQKESIRYYSGQGEGPSGIAYYTGISPFKIGSYLKSLEKNNGDWVAPERVATNGQRKGRKRYEQRPDDADVVGPSALVPAAPEPNHSADMGAMLPEQAETAGKPGRGHGRTSNSVVYMIEQMAVHGYMPEQISDRLWVSVQVARKYAGFDVAAYLRGLERSSETDLKKQEKQMDGRALRPETVERIKALAQKGYSISHIMQETGVGGRTVHKYAKAELEAAGGDGNNNGGRLTQEERKTILAVIETRKYSGPAEVGREFDISYHTASALWKKAGMSVRSIGKHPEIFRRRGNKLTGEEAAAIDTAIASGEYSCPAAVARDFHVSYQTARRHWREVEGTQPERAAAAETTVPSEPPQPAPEPTRRQRGLSGMETEHIDRLWRGGVRTTRGLAEATGLSRRAVQDYMERRGWESEWRREEKPRDNGPAQLPMFLGDLAGAIRKSTRGRMEEEAADQIAQHVLNFFGYSDRIIDNILEPEDRDLFYNLEDSGILTTEREETSLYDGKEWRIHYWMFRRDKIADIVAHAREAEKAREAEGADAVYGRVPEEVWRSHRIEPVEGIHVSPELAAANAGAKGTGTLPA